MAAVALQASPTQPPRQQHRGPHPLPPAPSPVPSFASTSTSHTQTNTHSTSNRGTAASRPFARLRSSVEATLRTATRSARPTTTARKGTLKSESVDDFATYRASKSAGTIYVEQVDEKPSAKGKEKEKEPMGMLRRVGFRRTTPSPIPPTLAPSPVPTSPPSRSKLRAMSPSAPSKTPSPNIPTHSKTPIKTARLPPTPIQNHNQQHDLPGFAPFVSPSMRQASLSSPTLRIPTEFLEGTASSPKPSPSRHPGPPTPTKPVTPLTRRSSQQRRTNLQPASPPPTSPIPASPRAVGKSREISSPVPLSGRTKEKERERGEKGEAVGRGMEGREGGGMGERNGKEGGRDENAEARHGGSQTRNGEAQSQTHHQQSSFSSNSSSSFSLPDTPTRPSILLPDGRSRPSLRPRTLSQSQSPGGRGTPTNGGAIETTPTPLLPRTPSRNGRASPSVRPPSRNEREVHAHAHSVPPSPDQYGFVGGSSNSGLAGVGAVGVRSGDQSGSMLGRSTSRTGRRDVPPLPSTPTRSISVSRPSRLGRASPTSPSPIEPRGAVRVVPKERASSKEPERESSVAALGMGRRASASTSHLPLSGGGRERDGGVRRPSVDLTGPPSPVLPPPRRSSVDAPTQASAARRRESVERRLPTAPVTPQVAAPSTRRRDKEAPSPAPSPLTPHVRSTSPSTSPGLVPGSSSPALARRPSLAGFQFPRAGAASPITSTTPARNASPATPARASPALAQRASSPTAVHRSSPIPIPIPISKRASSPTATRATASPTAPRPRLSASGTGTPGYVQNRHFNISSSELVHKAGGPSIPLAAEVGRGGAPDDSPVMLAGQPAFVRARSPTMPSSPTPAPQRHPTSPRHGHSQSAGAISITTGGSTNAEGPSKGAVKANANAHLPPRELVRTATALIIRELAAPPSPKTPMTPSPVVGQYDAAAAVAARESQEKFEAEVRIRVRVLVRMERGWGENSKIIPENDGEKQGDNRDKVKETGEEKERRVFVEVLRDGYVLCAFINKLRAAVVVRPDMAGTSTGAANNVAKFLAACGSCGLPSEDFFLKDDLTIPKAPRDKDKTKEVDRHPPVAKELAGRVARTIVALVHIIDTMDATIAKRDGGVRARRHSLSQSTGNMGTGERLGFVPANGNEKVWIRGQGLARERERAAAAAALESARAEETVQSPQISTKPVRAATTPNGTYGVVSGSTGYPQGSLRGASASTPNLALNGRESPQSPRRIRRWSPPEDLPPVRSNTPEEGTSSHGHEMLGGNAEYKDIEVPQIGPPPPPTKSLLRRKESTEQTAERERRAAKKDKSGGLFAWARSAAAPSLRSSAPPGPASTPQRSVGAVAPDADEQPGPRQLQGRPSFVEEANARAAAAGALDDLAARRDGGGTPDLRHKNDTPLPSLPHHHHSHSQPQIQFQLSPSARGSSPLAGQRNLSPANLRQSVVSTALSVADTDITTTSATSAFGFGYSGPAYAGLHSSSSKQQLGGNNGGMYGTIRTITTDMTSEAPSMSRAEGNMLAEEVMRKRTTDGDEGGSGGGGGGSSGGQSGWMSAISASPNGGAKAGMYGMGMGIVRERKMSEAPAVDLSRVAEETDESVSSKGHPKERRPQQTTPAPIHLHKGKWPDDFINAFQTPAMPIPSPTKRSFSDHPQLQYRHARNGSDDGTTGTDSPRPLSPLSGSPRKLAIIAARRGDGEQLPRRPTHRPRHSLDSPALLPKESILRRDASPEPIVPSSPSRLMLRRNSTKPEIMARQARYVPRSPSRTRLGNGGDEEGSVPDTDGGASNSVSGAPAVPVPFPRSISAAGDYNGMSPRSSFDNSANLAGSPSRPVRGRFQSDVDVGSRRLRPTSPDGVGVRPQRSRIESMVNLGGGPSGATSSDLMSRRSSMDGSAVRMRLIVREDGKPSTHFQLGTCIGRGQFGSVYKALNLNTGQMVAVKRIRLEGLKEEEVATLMREVDLVKSLSHPSIVKYEGMARDEDTLNIVLEYAENGSLGQTLKAFGKLNERLVASYVVKILEGLHYLHTSDVVHCDLKAANILTTKNGNVKLSDFGVSLNLRAMEREIKDVAGTPNWMAPEVIELKGASTKSDIWSLGCTVIELLTGRPPYAEVANSMSVMFRIVEDGMPPMPEESSEMLKDFLEQCFHKDPALRPSAEMLCEHPWLKTNWVALKELRPQDSIPFLRRVSTDLHKAELNRHFAQMENPDSPISASPSRRDEAGVSPVDQRVSAASARPVENNEFSPREHKFVKTTFSKAVICRVCQTSVKNRAVLCSECSLISHSKCTVNAPPTCNLREQLLLYAQYAEKGNPASLYTNPADGLPNIGRNPAMSDVPYVEHNNTPRTSTDLPQPPKLTSHQSGSGTPEHPPTAFKFMAGLWRSRSNLTPEPQTPASPTPPQANEIAEEAAPPVVARKRTTLQKRLPQQQQERPLSMTSASTGFSSQRSAATAAESFSSRQQQQHEPSPSGGLRSQFSSSGRESEAGRRPNTDAVLDRGRPSKIASPVAPSRRLEATTEREDEAQAAEQVVPGALPKSSKRHKSREPTSPKSSNCVLQ
ncbi:hypothetical protein D9619_006466 [Psilocybe cf. subviscida]|uniref:Protein kinase domain-containing protein n=1 Tax=Psilocybe cf. subviscida TaxID=2480587 RepID=A0A8H5EY64_9AGAR|nr:hypothetical protein D9619_006466 [Psilocybe cf. subviscida]